MKKNGPSSTLLEREQLHSLTDAFLQDALQLQSTIDRYIEIATDTILLISELEQRQLLPNELRHLSRQIVEDLCSTLAQQKADDSHNYCLFSGKMRMIFTFIKAYEVYRDESYLVYAKDLLKEDILEYASSSSLGNGLHQGRAGLLLGVLYCRSYLKEPYIDQLIRITFDLIVDHLQLQKKGVSLFYPDRHIAPLCDLAQGNAGLLWLLLEVHKNNSGSPLGPLISSLGKYIDSEWSTSLEMWPNYYKDIRSFDDHRLFVDKWKADHLDFFIAPEHDYSFWQGSLGIVTSLLYYNQVMSTFPGRQTKGKILKTLEKQKSSAPLTHQRTNPTPSLLAHYCSYRLTGNRRHWQEAKHIFLNSSNPREKIGMHLSTKGNSFYTNHIIPRITPKSTAGIFSSHYLAGVRGVLINKKYRKTIELVNTLSPSLVDDNFSHINNFLNDSLYRSFRNFLRDSVFPKYPSYKKVITDCLKFETMKLTFAEAFPNKILLKTEEIVHYTTADQLLKLPKETLLQEVMHISEKVKIAIFSWNWAQHNMENIRKALDTPPDPYVILTQIRTFARETEEFALSEAQLLLIEKFYEPVSVAQALEDYYLDYEVTSEEDKAKIKSFVFDTIDFLLYNRFIVRYGSKYIHSDSK